MGLVVSLSSISYERHTITPYTCCYGESEMSFVGFQVADRTHASPHIIVMVGTTIKNHLIHLFLFHNNQARCPKWRKREPGGRDNRDD